MTSNFKDVARTAENALGDAFIPRGENLFSVTRGDDVISFAAITGEPAMVIIRMRIAETEGVTRREALALAALAGNFFWSGTGGATLSLGEDGALWLTERREAAELANAEGFAGCVASLHETATAWRERSALYE